MQELYAHNSNENFILVRRDQLSPMWFFVILKYVKLPSGVQNKQTLKNKTKKITKIKPKI